MVVKWVHAISSKPKIPLIGNENLIQILAVLSSGFRGSKVKGQKSEVRFQRTDASDCDSRSISCLLFYALCLLSSDFCFLFTDNLTDED